MLERVSPTAECAAHRLLRLKGQFWKHDTSVPKRWWRMREKSQDQTRSFQLTRPSVRTFTQEVQFIKNVDLKRKWTQFVEGGCDGREAAPLLHELASAASREELQFSLKAFEFVSNKSADDYRVGVGVAVRLSRFAFVVQTIREATAKHKETIPEFLVVCLSNELWGTAAELWRDFSGDIDVSAIRDLPSRLANLAKRLKSNDAVVAADSPTLHQLFRSLTAAAVQSEHILNTVSAEDVLELLANDGKLYLSVIATIGKMSQKGTRSQTALKVYRRYKTGVVPQWVFGTLIGVCAAGRQPPDVFESLVRDYCSFYGIPSRRIYLQVIKALAEQGETDRTEALFREFCGHYTPRTADELNPMLRVHAITGQYQKTRCQFDKLFKNIKPSVKNWNALLLACVRSDDSPKAYAVFEEMKQSVTPDAYSWSILMSVASKRGDVEEAQKVMQQSKAFGVVPPLAMTGALVDSLLLNDNVAEATSVVVEATVRSKESPIRLWNSLFRHHAFKADSNAIMETQKRMRRLGVKADSMTYGALMTALVVQRRTGEAVKILRFLDADATLSASEFHYSVLVHGFAMEKNVKSALTVYQEMMDKFPRPTASARLSILYLQTFCEEEAARADKTQKLDVQKTVEQIRGMLAVHSPASSTPSPGFRRRPTHNDMSDFFVSTFLRRSGSETQTNLLPTTTTHETEFVRLSRQLEYTDNFVSVWDQIVSLHSGTNKIPKVRQYVLSWPLSVLIKRLGERGMFDKLFETLHQLRGSGFSLSSKNWNSLVSTLCRSSDVNHWPLAFRLFERHLLQGAPSWRTISRGQWTRPGVERRVSRYGGAKTKVVRRERRLLERLDPGRLMPTYFCLVHLASVWASVEKLSRRNGVLKERLQRESPGTVGLVCQTPYLRDRLQGVLLRGRAVKGDPSKKINWVAISKRKDMEPTCFYNEFFPSKRQKMKYLRGMIEVARKERDGIKLRSGSSVILSRATRQRMKWADAEVKRRKKRLVDALRGRKQEV